MPAVEQLPWRSTVQDEGEYTKIQEWALEGILVLFHSPGVLLVSQIYV